MPDAQPKLPSGLIGSVQRALRVLERVAEVADSPEHRKAEPLDLGFDRSAHATSFGKVLLAAMSPTARRHYLAGTGLARLTNRTITRVEDLDRELATVRRTGIAAEIEE